MDSDYLNARITAVKAQIEAYEAAILAITTGAVESYRIDTGQTVTNVTKLNISSIQSGLDLLLNRLATLEARLNGSGSITITPGW